MALATLKDTEAQRFVDDQKLREKMLVEMVHDALPWSEGYVTRETSFEYVINRMTCDSIANALERCTVDQIAEFLQVIGVMLWKIEHDKQKAADGSPKA